jgi:hypothetical protein
LNCITELRAKYSHRLPEFMDGLIELSKSPNETIRLQATRELLDRLLGRARGFRRHTPGSTLQRCTCRRWWETTSFGSAKAGMAAQVLRRCFTARAKAT